MSVLKPTLVLWVWVQHLGSFAMDGITYFLEIVMINLTPHTIILKMMDSTIEIPPSGTVARVTTKEEYVGDAFIGDSIIPVCRRTFGEVENLPEEGNMCIVSALVLAAVPDRKNTFAPDTGPTAIRNEKGQIEAVTRLIVA